MAWHQLSQIEGLVLKQKQVFSFSDIGAKIMVIIHKGELR